MTMTKTRSPRPAATSIVLAAVCTLAACLLVATPADAASPQLNNISPRGFQRGTEVTMALGGDRLGDAVDLMFYEPGFELLGIGQQKNGKRIEAKVRIAADCALGEHRVRVRTKTGISDMHVFFVGPFPNVNEAEPNNAFDAPQAIEMNSTVNGRVQNEDVDYYAFEAKKGQRISIEVESMRLGGPLSDLYAAILDDARFELAASDDSSLLGQDPVATCIAPKDGRYYVQVRDSSYGGGDNHHYRLHVGAFPRPIGVIPAGGQPGETLAVTYLGDAGGPFTQDITVPTGGEPFQLVPTVDGASAPSPNPFRVVELRNAIEAEPNNNKGEAQKIEGELPVAINGVIEKDGDQDWYKFTVKKGRQFHVRVHARSLGSPIDAVINVFLPDGKHMVGNDDSGGPDSYVRFNPPVDGEYSIRVRDHLNKGGDTFFYRIEFAPISPSISLSIPSFERYRQSRQHAAAPQGNRTMTLIDVRRENYGGKVVLDAPGLPQGMTMHAPDAEPYMGQIPVVFEAGDDAPVAGALVDLQGRDADPAKNIAGSFSHAATMIRYRNTDFYSVNMDRLAVAVTERAPFRIELETPTTPLVQNGTMNLVVKLHRDEGFNDDVRIEMPWMPPGVGGNPSITIPKGQTQGNYPINANGGARVGTFQIALAGTARGIWVSTQLTPLEIQPPMVSLKVPMSAVEQGQETTLVCEVTHRAPFDGEATLTLHGLPARVTAEPVKITKESTQAVFTIKAEGNAPTGKRDVFVHTQLPTAGGAVAHNIGHGGVVRIDPPPPSKPQPVATPAPAPKPEPKPEPKKEETKPAPKPLSRLEKLRLQAEEARNGE